MFVTGLPDSDPADVLAALIVFRLFYLLTPFAVSLLLILLFERGEFVRRKLYLDRSGPSKHRRPLIRLIVEKMSATFWELKRI